MDNKLKPWKYGLLGIAGASLLGIASVVIVGYFDVAWLAGTIPVIILGYLGGRWGGKESGTSSVAFFGGALFTILATIIVAILAMIVFQFGHATPSWFVPLVIIACLIAGVYYLRKDFRNGK